MVLDRGTRRQIQTKGICTYTQQNQKDTCVRCGCSHVSQLTHIHTCSGGVDAHCPTMTSIFLAVPVQVEVQDTVGCGDSFAAAIVLGYIRSHDIPATLVLANAVGAATAMGRGAGTNVASAPTVS